VTAVVDCDPRTASLHGWPLGCYQSNGLILPVMST